MTKRKKPSASAAKEHLTVVQLESEEEEEEQEQDNQQQYQSSASASASSPPKQENTENTETIVQRAKKLFTQQRNKGHDSQTTQDSKQQQKKEKHTKKQEKKQQHDEKKAKIIEIQRFTTPTEEAENSDSHQSSNSSQHEALVSEKTTSHAQHRLSHKVGLENALIAPSEELHEKKRKRKKKSKRSKTEEEVTPDDRELNEPLESLVGQDHAIESTDYETQASHHDINTPADFNNIEGTLKESQRQRKREKRKLQRQRKVARKRADAAAQNQLIQTTCERTDEQREELPSTALREDQSGLSNDLPIRDKDRLQNLLQSNGLQRLATPNVDTNERMSDVPTAPDVPINPGSFRDAPHSELMNGYMRSHDDTDSHSTSSSESVSEATPKNIRRSAEYLVKAATSKDGLSQIDKTKSKPTTHQDTPSFTIDRMQTIRKDIRPVPPLPENANKFTSEIYKMCQEQQALLATLLTHAERLTLMLHERHNCSVCLETTKIPYTIQECAHTFCYDCIKAWLVNNKVCPLCRTSVQKEPSLAKEIMRNVEQTLMITEPDSLEEYLRARQHHEEAVILPFDDLFSRTVIWDAEDGVDRCASCTWEVGRDGCQNPSCIRYSQTNEEVNSWSSMSSELGYDSRSSEHYLGTDEDELTDSNESYDDSTLMELEPTAVLSEEENETNSLSSQPISLPYQFDSDSDQYDVRDVRDVEEEYRDHLIDLGCGQVISETDSDDIVIPNRSRRYAVDESDENEEGDNMHL